MDVGAGADGWGLRSLWLHGGTGLCVRADVVIPCISELKLDTNHLELISVDLVQHCSSSRRGWKITM